MKTKAILSAAAWCLLTLAQAQEGATPVPAGKASGTTDAQAPATPQKSMYHTCFVAAGPSTWKALGLDEQQVARVGDLQSRYKAELAPPKVEKKGKGKSTAATTAPAKDTKATPAPPVSTHVTTPVDKEAMDPMKEKAEEGTVEAVTMDPMAVPQGTPVDQEFRAILTAQQLTLWEKKCSHNEPIGVVTP